MIFGILNKTEAVFRVMSGTSVISEIKHTGIILLYSSQHCQPGTSSSELLSLRRNTTLVTLDSGEFKQATSDEDGS